MKKIVVVFLLFVFQFGFSQTEGEDINSEEVGVKWENSFAETKKLAQEEDKKILIFFTGSDWCTFCKALEEDVIHTEKFKDFSKNTILYKADFPRAKDLVPIEQQKENKQLKDKYDIETYPVLVITDKNGKMIAKKKSYNLMRDPDYHFMFLQKYLSN